VTTGLAGEMSQALETVGNPEIRPGACGGIDKYVISVAFGLFVLTQSDCDPGACRKCNHQMPARRRGDGFVGRSPGCDQVATGQRNRRRGIEIDELQLRLLDQPLPRCLARFLRPCDVSRGWGRSGRRRIALALERTAELCGGFEARVGRGSSPRRVSMVRERVPKADEVANRVEQVVRRLRLRDQLAVAGRGSGTPPLKN
jgi:hypothetical protein